ncbi:hypothetical protein B0A48_08273 [Cryoendolithus antarcticus]|uniref:Uncharacterized protein n=1 Tax=Cryoendolithus antarcticus TaxID=1507870 RepID=A0A1V8T561_9PEZI|nr:hypothetical protein B0A48_08273 [Cryoendolithus antarcticus]
MARLLSVLLFAGSAFGQVTVPFSDTSTTSTLSASSFPSSSSGADLGSIILDGLGGDDLTTTSVVTRLTTVIVSNTSATTGGQACQTSQVSWSELYTSLRQPHWETTSFVNTIDSTVVTYNVTLGNADVYTTIDGIPHARATLTPTATSQFIDTFINADSTTRTLSSLVEQGTADPSGSPNCTIDSVQCSTMWQTYLGSLGLPTTVVNATEPVITPVPTNRPRCSVGPVSKSCGTVAPASCIISANKVDLFYWPAVTAAPNATGQSSNGSAIVTAVYGTHTFTSPSVYLLFDKIQAISTSDLDFTCTFSASLGGKTPSYAGGGGTSSYVGPAVSALVSLDPSSLSSLVRDLGPSVNTASVVSEIAHGGPSYSYWLNAVAGTYSLYEQPFVTSVLAQKVDFANFDVPPASAYYMNINVPPGCNRQGAHPECSTIFDAAYKAQLLVPDQIRTLRPEWATCSDPLFGALDPPIALSAAGTVEGPGAGPGKTSAAEVTTVPTPTALPEQGPTTSAVPGSGVGTTGPAATAFPQTTNPVTIVQPVQSGGSGNTSPAGTGAGSQPGPSTGQPIQSAEPGTSPTAGEKTSAANQPGPGTLRSGTEQHSALQPAEGANGGTTQPVGSGAAGTFAPVPVSTANIVIGSVTLAIPVASAAISDADPAATVPAPSITLAGTTILASAASNGVVVLDGTTVTAGGSPVVVGSQTVQVIGGGVVADGTTISIPSAIPASVVAPADDPQSITLGSATLAAQAGASGVVVVGGTTLSAGGVPVVIAGQTVNIVPSGIIVDGTTISLGGAGSPLAAATTAGSVTVVTLNSAAFTVSAPSALGAAVVNGVTLSAGGPATRIDGQLVSATSGGVVVDGQTVSLAPQVTPGAAVLFTATNGQSITASQGSATGLVIVGGSTLSVGGAAVTISGQVISAATGGVVVDGSTVAFQATTSSNTPSARTTTSGSLSSSTGATVNGSGTPGSSAGAQSGAQALRPILVSVIIGTIGMMLWA